MYLAVPRLSTPFFKKPAHSISPRDLSIYTHSQNLRDKSKKKEERKEKRKRKSFHQQMMTFLGRFSTDDDDDDLRACTADSGKA